MKIIREELSKYGIILLDEKKDIKEILLDSMVNGNIPDDVCKKMWVEYKERRKDSYEFVADIFFSNSQKGWGRYTSICKALAHNCFYACVYCGLVTMSRES